MLRIMYVCVTTNLSQTASRPAYLAADVAGRADMSLLRRGDFSDESDHKFWRRDDFSGRPVRERGPASDAAAGASEQSSIAHDAICMRNLYAHT